MKHLFPILLAIAGLTSGCKGCHAQTKVKSPFKTQIADYTTLSSQIAKVESDDEIVFLESSTAKLGYYSLTEVSMIDKTAKPKMLKDFKSLNDTKPILLYNGKQIALPKPINDCVILLPTTLTSFSLGSDKYLLLQLDLVSFSGNNGCEYLLLKLDPKGNLVRTSDFQTAEALTQADLGDFDGDGILDFRINATGKTKRAIYRTTDGKQLKG